MKHLIAVLLLALATAAAAAQSPPAGRSVTGAGYVFKPDPADYYPSASRALNEEGLTKVNLCYDDRGRPVEVTVDESSGFSRLDEAAVRYGKAVRVRPGLIDGQPQPGCVVVPVRFSAKQSQEPPDQREKSLLPPVQVPPSLINIPLPPPPPRVLLTPIPLAHPPAPGNVIPLGG